MIKLIEEKEQKQQIARVILESLQEWFSISDARESYISNCVDEIMLAYFENNLPVGFLCLKETSKDTVEIAVMGVLKQYQRNKIGQELFEKAKQIASQKGYSFIQVKTVQMGKYEEYDKTNLFYKSLGFKELEVFPTLWDAENPCQIYIMSI